MTRSGAKRRRGRRWRRRDDGNRRVVARGRRGSAPRAPPAGRPQAAAGAPADPGQRLRPGRGGATAGAVGGLADSGLVVRLTRGRLWIGLLGALLVGIVALNVVALSFSASSSEAGRRPTSCKRQNSALRARDRHQALESEVQAAAASSGLVIPGPGAIRYLRPSADDAAEAARRLRAGELGVAGYVAADHDHRRSGGRRGRAAPAGEPRGDDRRPRPSPPPPRSPRPRRRPRPEEAVARRRAHRRPRHRPTAEAWRRRDLIDRRVGLLFAAFVLLLAIVLVRAAWVQGVNGGSLSAEAQSQQVEMVVVPGSRGTILDRAGKELAVSEDAATCSRPRTRSRTPRRRRTSSPRSWVAMRRRSSASSPTASRASPTSSARSTSTRRRRSAARPRRHRHAAR